MTAIGFAQFVLFVVLLLLIAKPLGMYLNVVMNGGKCWLDSALRPIERVFYKLYGVDPEHDMHWTEYTIAALAFSLVSLIFTYAILRLQGSLPFNPMAFSTAAAPAYATTMTPDLAFNTAVSFTTNTNWQ